MKKLLQKLFGTHREFVGNFIETGEALIALAASNQIVAAELEDFSQKARTLKSDNLLEAAELSANALSGYGISVRSKAFLETLTEE
ncbi:MAG: hypothetical protein KC877_04375 [Candidatus Kaiserbacteria bacterium]|nr:hypothetical protein [Candidatus Kaiserbacteria bacterium]MCB9816677.1 hypothetical protein [Candidatus Nomurabacteria bacterium]